jgi:hypothetical protein
MQKASTHPYDWEVFQSNRLVMTERLLCLDCGYHFAAEEFGKGRLQMAKDLGYKLGLQKLARRLRDPWKPSSMSWLTVDHVIPEAGPGPTAADNLRITCQFCNGEKRIYRRAGVAAGRDVASAMLALGTPGSLEKQ